MASKDRIIRADEPDRWPRDPHGWQVREGLTFSEVEQMLDWLESSGVDERAVELETAGTFRIRWRTA